MTSFNIYEAYAAVYNEDLREELLIEETILLESIEELYDDELEEIVEESIYNMLDEGYDIDEVEEIFEEVFSEARVNMAARIAQRRREEEKSEKSATEARSRGASVVRKEKRAANIDKIKGRIKGAVKTAMTNVRNVVDKPARNYAADRGLIASKSGKTKLGTGEKGQGGILQKQTTSAGRREVRGAVVKDLVSRAQAKLGRGVEAVKSSSDAAQKTMRDAGSAVKKGAKGLLGGAARAVSRGARDVARRLGEDVDLYDIVLEHLLDEGFADTEEAATVIMANMSEEWRESIVEDTLDEARRADKLGHERGTAANPNRNEIPHSDPAQQTMLHSRLRRRADEMGRERRGSSEYRSGRRPSLSKKEKAFLQASDRTSPGRGHVRSPNVPDTGSHAEWPSERRAQKDPKQNPKHNANK